MILNLDIELDRQRFQKRCEYLKEKRVRVELKEKRRAKTLPQNNYVHLIMTAYGAELGYTLAEMKLEVKRTICPQVFRYVKEHKAFYRSFAQLDTLEMTIVIDTVRNHAAQNGTYLPAPNETEQLQSLEEQLSRYGNRQYV